MATVTFSYRSKKDKAQLEARLSFRVSGNPNPFSFYTRSEIEVSKDFWNEYKSKKSFKDKEKINLKKEIDDHTHDLRTHVLDQLKKNDIDQINKDWFKNVVERYYSPPAPEAKDTDTIPVDLIGYIKYYNTTKGSELSKAQKTKWEVIKNKMLRFEKTNGKNILLTDVNENFKNDFRNYYEKENYSQNTIQREFGFIKTLCRHARSKGLDTSPDLDTLSFEKDKKVPKIYLDKTEIKAISELKNLPDYLDNARDWLLISCYTGQRVSDFMRFTKEMIVFKKGVPVLEFDQIKTGKSMTIPLLPEVMEILKKRNGEFPRQTSDQRYNEYIKDVCKEAKINKKTNGRLQLNVSDDPKKKSKIRNISGVYPKYKLVSSHIGRRTFATNYYGTIPTTHLINITGHSTEKMFLTYIGKGQSDYAVEAYKYLTKNKE